MKMKFGAIVVDGRGKIGGHVASKNRSGAYLRTKVTPSNPQTAAQQAVRANMAANSAGYAALTEAQRDTFIASVNDFTKNNIFGDSVKLSGINIYTRLNNNLALIGAALISVAPVISAVPVSTLLSASIASGAATATIILDAAIPAGCKAVVRATQGMSAGRNFVKSEFRNIEILDPLAETPVDIKASYIAKFGELPAVGKKVFFEIFLIDIATGIAGQKTKISTIVAA